MIAGIDLGTTNSLVCIWRNGKAEPIPNSFGEYLTPSVVGLDDSGQIVVGKVAKERLFTRGDMAIANFKRYMGSKKTFVLGNTTYTPEELSSFILRKLVDDVEAYTNEKVEELIISVPAYFDDKQRTATKHAGKLAGIVVERIVNEPSAAALAIHHYRKEDTGTYMVIDMGGGTLDVSVVDAFDNVIEIVAVAGDNHLGGEDFNQVIAKEFLSHHTLEKAKLTDFEKENLARETERAKIALNMAQETPMKVSIGGEDREYLLTYKRFFEISSGLLLRIEKPICRAIEDCQGKIDGIDAFVMVGGGSRMRIVQEFVSYLLGEVTYSNIATDLAIGIGCGIAAGIKERKEDIKDLVLTDICPFSLGIGIVGNKFSPIIERNTTLPCSKEVCYRTTHKGQSKVDILIYQGESLDVEENIHLGSLSIDIPVNYAQEELVKVRFTYDINGILDVDVTIVSTGAQKSMRILYETNQLSEKQLQEKILQLQALKLHPRQQEIYQYMLEKGKAAYTQLLGKRREALGEMIRTFEHALDTQDKRLIERSYHQLKDMLEV